MKLSLAWIADALETGRDAPPGVFASGYSIDTRTLQPGDLFFALAGTRTDGHDFIARAFDAGAVAAVVDRKWEPPNEARRGLLLRVDNPAEALAALASAARKRWRRPVIGITGSNGKTTTKEIVAALLGVRLRVAKTAGNLNNQLGVPLTLLRAPSDAEVAVIEMGMNHAGEIRRLARLARPKIGLVTNVSAAHIGNFKSLAAVALAKRELVEELGSRGTAVLNADDRRVREFAAVHNGPVATFGVSPRAHYRATQIESSWDGARFTLVRTPGGDRHPFRTRLPGRHNVLNLTAGLAVAGLFGMEPEELEEAVASVEAARMRGRVRTLGGARIFDDSYNSNPASAAAALDALGEATGRRRIAVLGEMRELGKFSKELHAKLGKQFAASGVDLLLAVGGDAESMRDGALAAGASAERVLFFADAPAAGEALAALLQPGDAVLFKGSRGVGLEQAVQRLETEFSGETVHP